MKVPRQQIIRVTANEQKSRAESHVSWRVSVRRLWGTRAKAVLILRPYFDERWIAAVRAPGWQQSPQTQELAQLRRLLDDKLDYRSARDVRRSVASTVFKGRLACGMITIPKEIVWLLAKDNPTRDVTIVNVGAYLELWPTVFWQRRMLGQRVANGQAAGAASRNSSANNEA